MNDPSKISNLNLDEIIRLHDEIINKSGGEHGLLNLGSLEFALDFIQGEVIRTGTVDVFELAARIARGIIQDHPFVDGNKRTGMESSKLFLEKNGYRFVAELGEAIDFALRVAKAELKLESLREWFRDHSENIYKVGEGMAEYSYGETMDDKQGPAKRKYNISEESERMIVAMVKRDLEFLKELAKY